MEVAYVFNKWYYKMGTEDFDIVCYSIEIKLKFQCYLVVEQYWLKVRIRELCPKLLYTIGKSV